ncbi:MAG: T9SS type A sorting domain-containing protein [Bacteroidetes bacterium]|jgi:hypothetical protein|nr:T9SS type A sorting domain-containing protein [Bacteroidota bacterium]MBT6687602.1 T9SS type A sorting domain-containing protein [Bacteroidota bacterium]MBT7143661.1 T9SS type A sorting domain-containing protein [Bacteroidota bacterium]MBT7492315.1 T9SS type A sorting domain-containing protein [Bacteroidota bacterium]
MIKFSTQSRNQFIFLVICLFFFSQQVFAQNQILIIDLDGNTNSGPAIQTAIQNNGLNVDYSTSIPTSLNQYSAVFVCLGIFSANHVLSSAEGQELANFVNSGNNIYMEGGDTWAYDNQTNVHGLFNIDGTSDGTGDLDNIMGISGSFVDTLIFNYIGENSYIDKLDIISPAFTIFENSSPVYDCAIAHDAGTYKTIGCSFEFGGLEDDTLLNTKDLLMEKYLQFFELFPENAIDAAIVEIIDPQSTEGEGDTVLVKVILKNVGNDSLLALDIGFSLNGNIPIIQNWTDTLLFGETDTVDLQTVVIPQGFSEICAYTILPTDSFNINDTICKDIFAIPANDAGIVEIQSIPSVAGSHNIYTKIQNFGYSNLQNLTLEWKVDSIVGDSVLWTGNINQNSISDFILVGNFNFAVGSHEITVNTSNPNGVADINNLEDTLSTSITFFSPTLIDTFPYCESFEDTIGFWQQLSDDDFDWTSDENGTQTGNTGPSSATDGNFYLYTEASSPRVQGDIAIVEALFDFTSFSFPEISFDYHMYGTGMGSMHLDIYDTIWHEDVWQMFGNQGNSWNQAIIPIIDFGGQDSIVIRFRGIVGNGIGPTYRSDMAIDNFCISEPLFDDMGVVSFLTPTEYICSSNSEIVSVVFMNYGAMTQSNIPIKLIATDPVGVSLTFFDTLIGPIGASELDTIYFNNIDLSISGIYSLSCFCTLQNDQNLLNDSISFNTNTISAISSFPYTENFESVNNYFNLFSYQYSDIYIFNEGSNKALRFEGGISQALWTGYSGSVTAQNAWEDNTAYHSSAISCNIDASSLQGLVLQFDLKQKHTNSNDNSWFRVLINDSIQISDEYGVSNFNPNTSTSDPYEPLKFNLSAYSGGNFSLSFQACCKYNGDYNSTNYPDGDQALIDNIVLYEPDPNDVGVISIVEPNGIICGNISQEVEVIISNNGGAEQFDIPITVELTDPLGNNQVVSGIYTDTILPGNNENMILGTFNTTFAGNYQILAYTSLSTDSIFFNDSIISGFGTIANISQFPFVEDFQTANTDYFNIYDNSQSSAYYFNDNGDIVLRFEGNTNSGWYGSSGSISPQNAWINNSAHHSGAISCNVEANTLQFLNMDIDFRQSDIITITDYSWFRVLVNDTIQLSDINGVSNFNPNLPQGDPYQVRTFILDDFCGSDFKLTLQASCKYDSSYSYQSVDYPEGDAVFIRSISIYEPPEIDILVNSIIGIPEISCDLSNNQSIGVNFTNNGMDTLFIGQEIPFSFSINNNSPIQDTMILNTNLANAESVNHTFSTTADFSDDGEHIITAWAEMPGDPILANDTAMASAFNILNISTFPYSQDFETVSDEWVPEIVSGTENWDLGNPSQTVINFAHSGNNAWMTNLNADYEDSTEIMLYSPCFDFSDIQSITISFWLFIYTEADYDGMVFESSTDGILWEKVIGENPDFYNSNFSQSTILDEPWWNGYTGAWQEYSTSTGEFAGISSVRFRFRFASDGNTNYEGIAIDDFLLQKIFLCETSENSSVCNGDSTEISVIATGGSLPYTYNWSPTTGLSDPTISNPMASPQFTTSYNVTVTDASGAETASFVVVVVNPVPDVQIVQNIALNNFIMLDAGPGYISYEWSTGEISQTIEVTTSGTYSVTVENTSNCFGSDEVAVIVPGIFSSNFDRDIKLYPNPNKGKVFVEIGDNSSEIIVTIFDNTSKAVLSNQYKKLSKNSVIEINLKTLAKGSYFARIENNNYVTFKKIIIY